MLCVDEKIEVQALDRTASVLPLMPGVPERRTHDYKRAGTTNLYAALDVASGNVIADLTPRQRAEEFRRFLNVIDKSVFTHLDVHLILDNSSTHKRPAIQRWLVRHPRFTLHFHAHLFELAQPRGAMVRRTHHEVVAAGHPSLGQKLVSSIRTWITNWNDDPKPFVWHKTADEILGNLAAYCQRISDSGL